MDRSRKKQNLSSSSLMSTNVKHICNDIIVQILSRMPVDSLLRFKSVSKSWLSLITNPKFVKLHNDHHHHYLLTTPPQTHNPTIMFTSITHYSLKSMDKLVSSSSSSTVVEKLEMVYPFDSKKFEIVGSCNGLICIRMMIGRKEFICLWNPSTKEFKQLPSHEDIDDAPPFKFPSTRRRSEDKIATFGFGYDHVMEDYKIIASVQWFSEMDDEYYDSDDSDDDDDEEDMYHYELKVYTLGTDSWRRIQGTPYEQEWRKITTWSFVNGAFHRIAQLYKHDVAILSFDIVEEVYREVPRPDCFLTRYGWELAVLRGCLCLCSCDCLYVNSGFTTEVWMMMNYGVEESWTKLFSITNGVEYSPRFKPLWFCRNGELLMVEDSKLAIYDPSKHNEAKLLLKWRSPFETVSYIASLVSLKSQKEIEKELIIC